MKTYTQKGYLHYILMIGLLISLLIIFFGNIATDENAIFHFTILGISIFVFLVGILFFYKLSLTLDEDALVLKLGIDLYTRKYYYRDIKSVKVIPLDSFSGLGIRYLGKGWLYNLTLDNALELSFHHKSEIIQISIIQADEIVDVLDNIITNK